MVHDNRARPVSGEIMSAAVSHSVAAWSQDIRDVSDAQFQSLSRAGKAASAYTAITDQAEKSAAGMNFLRHCTTNTREAASPGGLLFWSAGVACAALAFWISGGHTILMNTDAVSPTGTKQALQIESVKSRVEAVGENKILFIDGLAKNHGPLPLALPPVEIAVIGNDGSVIRYQLGDREPQLESGSRYEFSSRLQAPAAGVKTVSVSFTEERH